MSNGLPVEQMSRHALEHEVKLLRQFNERYEEVIKLTCKKVPREEAHYYNRYFQFDDEYYLHPLAKQA